MYRILNIAGQDYKLEYSIEASLYSDCTEKITTIMSNMQSSGGENGIRNFISGISNVPQTALCAFYAGLLEHHGSHQDGDGCVPDLYTAKNLIAAYIREHKDDETGNFYGVLKICLDQMSEDGFFDLIGLKEMMKPEEEDQPEETPKALNPPKIPQDHKKKASGK